MIRWLKRHNIIRCKHSCLNYYAFYETVRAHCLDCGASAVTELHGTALVNIPYYLSKKQPLKLIAGEFNERD